MNKPQLVLLVAAVALLQCGTALAQPRGRTSPHETVSAVIGGNRVTITYGRPFSKNPRGGEIRKIWGTLVPYGAAWRLGADEATTIILQRPIQIGETTIPAGAHTLYMVPEENGGKLAFSSALGGWGIPVDESKDVARVDLRKEALPMPNEQLAIAVEQAEGGGAIKIMWEATQYVLSFRNAP
jgi:hypothetical protein